MATQKPTSYKDSRTHIYTVDMGDGTIAEVEGPANATPEQLQQFIAQQQTDKSTGLDAYAGIGTAPDEGQAGLDPIGESEFARPEDRAFAEKAQALLVNGGTRQQFDDLSRQYGYPLYGPDLDEAIAAKGIGWRIGVPLGGHQEASILAPVANSDLGAMAGFAGDTGAIGLSDEIAGLAGGDSIGDVIAGTGEAQRRAQLLKDTAREERPIASAAGQLVGGLTGVAGFGKLAGSGRQLAADTAFGAAYGAGESNDNREMGAALGGGSALAGSYFGGKLLDKFSAASAARQPSGAASKVAAAKDFDINIPMGATGRAGAIMEKGLDILPGSAGVMQKGRDVLNEEVGNAVETVADQFGDPTSFQGMGEAAQSGAKKWIDKFERVAGKLYDAIPIGPKASSDIGQTRAALESLTTKFESNPELAEAFKNTKLNRYLDALTEKVTRQDTGILDASGNPITRDVSSGGRLSWEDLKDFRSRIGEEIGEQRFSDSLTKTELRALYAALSEDMKATARSQGPAALAKFERANTQYRLGQERIDDALTTILGDTSKMAPESAAARMQAIAKAGKSTSDIKRLAAIRASMPAEEWGQVSNSLIRLMGQPLNSAGREFNAQTFIKVYDDMAPEAKNLFFSDRGRDSLRARLDEFSGVVRNLAENNALRNTSGTAGAANAAALASLLPAAIFSPAVAAGLAGQTAGSYGLAKLWTNPRFVQWATGYAKMVAAAAKAGTQPQGVGKQIGLLKKVAAAEPAIAQDALGLQQYLVQQFAASPGKLAAGENADDGGPVPPQ